MIKLFEFVSNHNTYKAYYTNKAFNFTKNGKLIDDFSPETKLMYQIFASLIPKSNTINLGNTFYHNKCYHHLLDLTNNWHLFYQDKGKLPPYNDFIALNYLYNNQLEYVMVKDNSNLKEKIKRIIKVGDKVFLVSTYAITLIFILSHYQEITKLPQGISEAKYEDAISYYSDAKLTVGNVVDLIKNNPNLNWQEKEYLSSFTDFFTDELPYVDEKDLKDNLNHMYTTYFYEHNPNFTGSWSYCGDDIYNIKVYESASNDMVLDVGDYPILRHEFFHTWSVKGDMVNNLGRYFYEFVNSVLANEYAYVTKNDDAYDWGYENNLGYVMLELFSPETIHEFHCQKNCNVLVRELNQILSDGYGYQLINIYDEYYRNQNFVRNMRVEDDNYEAAYQDYLNSVDNLKQLLKRYYEAKYHKNIEDNLYVYYYYDPDACEEKIRKVLNDYQIFFVNPTSRGYINKRLNQDYVLNLFGSTDVVNDLSEGYDIYINENGEILENLDLNQESIGSSFTK